MMQLMDPAGLVRTVSVSTDLPAAVAVTVPPSRGLVESLADSAPKLVAFALALLSLWILEHCAVVARVLS